MVISHRKKIIFIHNYKVAGTSVMNSLNEFNNDNYETANYFDKLKLSLL